jgi:hypothetical protein
MDDTGGALKKWWGPHPLPGPKWARVFQVEYRHLHVGLEPERVVTPEEPVSSSLQAVQIGSYRAYRPVEVATMIACILTWTEPEEGDHAIFFPNEAEADLREVAAYVDAKMGDSVGDTIAKMRLFPYTGPMALGYIPKGTETIGEDPWDDLALNIRYSSGEELYDEDCPALKRRGQERC